ncbi:MAG: phosphatidate cytidylyltransferase [Firmicutes bacterium]|nr:phosphatidate cytidylyltransferase [Bacillota bacterium]MBQ6260015.1 phosphatidate cytidylyltransferase [Bacillota bacterium]MBR0113701.1 phosphatidate cytidylyltransferase [Bacillota bacterium]MBR0442255.1 phosphatidate cytidylyltransferase [Bacillota bacterium]
MKTRIISACIMAPLLALVWLGGVPLFAACLIIAFMGMHEFYDGFRAMGKDPCVYTGYISAGLLFAAVYLRYFTGKLQGEHFASAVLAWLTVTMVMGLGVSLIKEDHDVFDGPLGALGSLYIAFFCVHVVMTERTFGDLVWLVFLAAFGTDIMAYFTGYFLGKHKLCPKLSPKKTVEGVVGGVIGSAVFCSVFALIAAPDKVVSCALAGLIASPFAQAGDLIASAFKRKMGIKDYGRLIPGHGGIMDRFDSVLLTAPFIYYVLLIVEAA